MEVMTSDHQVRSVNEDQCQMCMPLGGVIAFKGIEETMVLIHGSQGCSTYMRLSNVEHYHEPVDIASTALNEKQTIHGGEANLRKALDNVIRVYNPSVIGILTTCLTETMGEDLDLMISAYKHDRNLQGVDIIPVPTPSYSASHTEGFWSATRRIIEHYARATAETSGINIIIPHISPADIREIKRIIDLFGIEYTLIPDYSMTMDRPFGGNYQKIPPGGTVPADIARMPGAQATIQFGLTCPEQLSPGEFLRRKYNVPLFSLPLPIGLKNTDRFISVLSELSGRPVPEVLLLERGWLLDGMADAHKYNAEGRPLIYGEPELVYALCTLCAENGATPLVVASGTKTGNLETLLSPILPDACEKTIFLEGTDFAAIDQAVEDQRVNVAVGHSGGRFLTERRGIPVLRIGFPIHDRIGGQRIRSAGYAGTLSFLDRFTNALLEMKYGSYRQHCLEETRGKGGY
ncbi:nitrogenase component 1 [Methanocalculus sp.]|uniref:nitrogenase component 1 n=1 Tax=Methanocalculus sp. TaxID=2004547 RepID=UPI002717961A|nr:nitrogenase component 1 [Methanocalculus sp.]MDO8841207.1 nitrogenase component 1 [Methanocalculus sp.]